MKLLSLAVLLSSLFACGDVNLNGYIFVRDNQNKSLDVLTYKAQYHYDQGEFEKAKGYAEDALKLNSDNEEVRILLGYIYLSLGGIDTFQLSKSLINNSDNKETAGLALAEKDAAGTLSGLSSITAITDADIEKMGEKKASSIDIFSDYPVIYPDLATEVRDQVESLKYLNLAISMACPSVSNSVKIDSDPRHQNSLCPESSYEIRLPGKAHFLWAFAHLADALSFNKVVQYSTNAEGKANLEKRGEAAGSLAQSDLATYANVMSQLSDDISNIMQTDNENSQLNAVYNGLEAANLAFGQLTGVPEKITGSISKALASIKQGAQDTGKAENEVLKGQLNKKVTSEMGNKINQAAEQKPAEFAANKSLLCGTFQKISEGQGEQPQACN